MPILFDLDGTLADPRDGIVASLFHALRTLGAPVPPPSVLEGIIGPPIRSAMAALLETSDESMISAGVRAYRDEFARVGVVGNTIYPGVLQQLHSLRQSGNVLYVATSKAYHFAERIVQSHGLGEYFRGVYGSELDGTRSDKAQLIAHLVENEGIASEQCVMVGDRKHDMVGARENGVACIGVLWGFGSRGELEASGADAIIERPSQLSTLLATYAFKRTAGTDDHVS